MDPGVRSHGMKAGPPGYLWSKYESFLMSGWWDILHSSCFNAKLWSNSTNGTKLRTDERTERRKLYTPRHKCRGYKETKEPDDVLFRYSKLQTCDQSGQFIRKRRTETVQLTDAYMWSDPISSGPIHVIFSWTQIGRLEFSDREIGSQKGRFFRGKKYSILVSKHIWQRCISWSSALVCLPSCMWSFLGLK